MQIEGKKYKCDRCGLETFVAAEGDLVMDGGFTRQKTYAPANNWTRQNDGKEWRDLCPACSKQLKKILDNFWQNTLEG